MEAARDVDRYPTSALVIRKTYKDLSQRGGLLSRSHEWWKKTDAHWDGINKTWTFPTGATVQFGYMDNENDHHRYQGGEYQIICFDELTQLRYYQYIYLFTRLRKLLGSPVKTRVRAGTNPGGEGHEWVKKHFNLPDGPKGKDARTRRFVFSTLDDNPHLDTEEYEKSLAMLEQTGISDVSYKQLRYGEWDAVGTGGYFDTRKINLIDYTQIPHPSSFSQVLWYWDFGTTEPVEENPDPDWTVGLLIAQTREHRTFHIVSTRGEDVDGSKMVEGKRVVPIQLPDLYLLNIIRFRGGPSVIETEIRNAAKSTGRNVPIWLEQEKGAAGKNFVHSYRTHVLPGYKVRGFKVYGDKASRGRVGARACNVGRLWVPEAAPWWPDFKSEADVFNGLGKTHDDQIDVLGYGIWSLEKEAALNDGTSRAMNHDVRKGARRRHDPEAGRALGYY